MLTVNLTVAGDIRNLLPHLLLFPTCYREEARAIQREATQFQERLLESIEEVWQKHDVPSSQAAGGIKKPDLSSVDWRIEFIDA